MATALTSPTGHDLNQFLMKQSKALDNRVWIETTDGKIHWSRYFTVLPGFAGNGPYHVGKYQLKEGCYETPLLSSRDIVQVSLPHRGEWSLFEKISTDAFKILVQYLPIPAVLRLNCRFHSSISAVCSGKLTNCIAHNTEQNPMGIEEYRALRQLGIASFPEIHHLRLGRKGCAKDKSIRDEGLDDILQRFPNLNTLNIDGLCKITATGLKSITAKCRNLNSFSFKFYKELTLEGIKAISSLPLRSLSLSEGISGLDDTCMAEIAKISTLQDLDISGCVAVTNQGMEQLKSLDLRSVDISDCFQVTIEGIQAVVAMAHLEKLVLGGKFVTSIPLTEEQLETLAGHPSLKAVYLGCFTICKEAIKRLQAQGIPIIDPPKKSGSIESRRKAIDWLRAQGIQIFD